MNHGQIIKEAIEEVLDEDTFEKPDLEFERKLYYSFFNAIEAAIRRWCDVNDVPKKDSVIDALFEKLINIIPQNSFYDMWYK